MLARPPGSMLWIALIAPRNTRSATVCSNLYSVIADESPLLGRGGRSKQESCGLSLWLFYNSLFTSKERTAHQQWDTGCSKHPIGKSLGGTRSLTEAYQRYSLRSTEYSVEADSPTWAWSYRIKQADSILLPYMIHTLDVSSSRLFVEGNGLSLAAGVLRYPSLFL